MNEYLTDRELAVLILGEAIERRVELTRLFLLNALADRYLKCRADCRYQTLTEYVGTDFRNGLIANLGDTAFGSEFSGASL